jgi:hypothetical protein
MNRVHLCPGFLYRYFVSGMPFRFILEMANEHGHNLYCRTQIPISSIFFACAPVAQGIEQRFPKP